MSKQRLGKSNWFGNLRGRKFESCRPDFGLEVNPNANALMNRFHESGEPLDMLHVNRPPT